MRPVRQIKGFTLVETLVASTILCGSVLTMSAICTKSLSNARINRAYETAVSMLDMQLALIDYIGIDEFLEIGQFSGDFEDYAPGYYWDVATEYSDYDNLYYVTITVSWLEGRNTRQITVDTMLEGISYYTETGEGTG